MNSLAVTLHTLGDYDRARELDERALQVRERVLGPDHPDTTQSMNNLASALHTLGDYDRARELDERVRRFPK